MKEGNDQDSLGFDTKTKTLFASTYSYQIDSSGYIELDEKETMEIYNQMKSVYEFQDKKNENKC